MFYNSLCLLVQAITIFYLVRVLTLILAYIIARKMESNKVSHADLKSTEGGNAEEKISQPEPDRTASADFK